MSEGAGRTTKHLVRYDDDVGAVKPEEVVLKKTKYQATGFKFYLLD
jgi:hypothetical protein